MIKNSWLICVLFLGITIQSYSYSESHMETWVKLESQRGLLNTQWEEQKFILHQKLSIFEHQLSEYQEIAKQRDQSKTDLDTKRLELTQRQSTLEQEQHRIKQAYQTSLSRIQIIQHRLPPPLQNRVESIKQQHTDGTTQLFSSKLESLISVLKDIYEFDEKISVVDSEIKIKSGELDASAIYSTQIYLGLAYAWFFTQDGSVYGYGKPTSQGWQWFSNTEGNIAAKNLPNTEKLRNIVKMIEDTDNAKLVSLPIKISDI